MNIGTLTIELSANVAKLRTDMDQAKQVVTSGVEQISTAIATAKNALAGLGAVTSVAGFAALVDKTIESAAEMHRLAQRTGVAVESLSALKSAAKFTGTSMDEIGGAMQKLSKGMVSASEDGGKTGQALKLLGISVTDASGKMKSADQVTLEVAKSLEQYKDGAGKTALVMDIFGKSGANLLPMLAELAEKGNLNGKITTEQGKQAYEFEKALAKLKNQFTGMFNALALDLIPTISKMAGLFKTGMEVAVAYWAVFYGVPALVTMATAALGRLQMTLALVQLEMAQGATVATLFGRSIASIAGPAELAQGALGKLKVAAGVLIAAYAGVQIGTWLSENFSWARQAGIYMVGGLMQAFEALKAAGEVLWATLKSGFNAVIEPLGNMTAWLFEKIATGLKMIGAGEVSKALSEISDKIRSFSKNNSSFADELGKVTAEYQKNRAAITQNIDGMLEYERSEKKVAEATQNTQKELKATAEAAAAKESDYQKLIKTMREKVAAAEAELVAGRALNEAERERVKLLSDIANGTIKVTEYEKKRLLTQIGLLDSLLKSKQASEAMKKVFDDWNQASKQRIDAAEKEAEAAEKMVVTLGMTRSEIAQLELSRLQEQLAQRSSIGLTLDEIKELEKLIEAKRRSADAFKAAEAYDAALKAAQALADEWKRMADDINQSLSKAIMKGFTGTKGFITDFIAQLKGLFAKLVLQPILAPVSAGIASIMVPGGAQAQPGGAAGGIGGAVNAISTGQSIMSLISNGFTGMSNMLGNGIASLGGMIGSGSMSAFGAGMIAPNAAIHGTSMTAAEIYGSMGMQSSASAASLGSSVASAMPYVAAAVAAYYVATKGFGHGERKTESEDITANLMGGDVTGSKNVHHVKEGGWFSSDIRGVWNFDLNSGKTVADGVSYNDTTGTSIAAGKAIKAGYDSLLASTEAYAKALGVNADFLKTTSYSLSFDVGKTQEEFAQNLSKALGTVADAMANQIYPSINKLAKEGESAGQTLARVAGNVSSVNDVFGKLGFALYQINDAGLAAVDKLIEASGGLQNFQQASSNYYANFYSEEEKRATIIKQLTDEFAKANLGTLPQSREGFRALVEQMSKVGTSEQVATLLRLSGAFAGVSEAVEQSLTRVEQIVFYSDNLSSAQSMREIGGDHHAEVLSRRAAQALSAQQVDEQAKLFADMVAKSVAQVGEALLKGDAMQALSAAMQSFRAERQQYQTAGAVNVGALNALLTSWREKAAQELIGQASVNALAVQNISQLLTSLSVVRGEDSKRNESRQLSEFYQTTSDSMSKAFSSMFDAMVERQFIDERMASAPGIASVLKAQANLNFASYNDTNKSQDVIAYEKTLAALNWQFNAGALTSADYGKAVQLANDLIGQSVTLYRDQAAQLKAIQQAKYEFAQAGNDSIVYYFDRIAKSVADLSTEAEKLASPLAKATEAMGRMQSIADVLSTSARAAKTDVRFSDSAAKAEAVATAANLLKKTITTADASKAEQVLKQNANFQMLGDEQVKAMSFLLDGIKAFDANSLEAGFMRITDAFAKKTLNADQYKSMIDIAASTYKGPEEAAKSMVDSFTRLRDAMRSFSDQLLTDSRFTTLTSEQSLEQLLLQYGQAKSSAAAGDDPGGQKYQQLATALLDKSLYSSQAEYNTVFSRVYGDALKLESIGSANGSQSVVAELRRANQELVKKVDDMKGELTAALIQIARNTSKTSQGIEQLNTVGLP